MNATAFKQTIHQCKAWIFREEHRRRARELRAEVNRAFTEHPDETGESYLEHLWFTFKMSMRFVYTTIVLMLHGVFPFLLTRAASKQIELIYGTMKSRIPKARRDVLDSHYDL